MLIRFLLICRRGVHRKYDIQRKNQKEKGQQYQVQIYKPLIAKNKTIEISRIEQQQADTGNYQLVCGKYFA